MRARIIAASTRNALARTTALASKHCHQPPLLHIETLRLHNLPLMMAISAQRFTFLRSSPTLPPLKRNHIAHVFSFLTIGAAPTPLPALPISAASLTEGSTRGESTTRAAARTNTPKAFARCKLVETRRFQQDLQTEPCYYLPQISSSPCDQLPTRRD